MNRSHDLMRLHDGELTEDELGQLEAEDERLLDGLDQLGDVLRAHSQNKSASFDVADSVMARLDEPEPVEEAKPAPVKKLRKAPPPKARVYPVVAIGLALAAAAAWALWPKPGVDTKTRPAPIAQPVVAPQPSEEPTEEPGAVAQVDVGDDDGPAAASIESVDFGNHAGTIFMVPAGEESTPVIWLEDEDSAGRMERL
jgi:hypothetical protein